MPSGLLIRSRLLTGCMCAAVAAVIGGCSTTAPAPTVAGKTLTVYLSAPAGLSRDAQAQDVIDAEKLAFSPSCTAGSCAPVQVGSFKLHLAVVTDDKLSGNARSAIEDKTAVAYLGELLPGDSAD